MEREALVETLLRLAPRARGQNYLRVDFVLAGELMEVSVKDERLKPVQIAAATGGGEEPDFRYLLMPMRRPADVPGESGD